MTQTLSEHFSILSLQITWLNFFSLSAQWYAKHSPTFQTTQSTLDPPILSRRILSSIFQNNVKFPHFIVANFNLYQFLGFLFPSYRKRWPRKILSPMLINTFRDTATRILFHYLHLYNMICFIMLIIFNYIIFSFLISITFTSLLWAHG